MVAVPAARPAGASQISDLKAQAAQIEQEITSTQQRISALGQQYDQDQNQLAALRQRIADTRTKIANDRQRVLDDQATLRQAAVNAYINDGSESQTSILFSSNQQTLASRQEYNQVAEGDLGTAVADLHTAETQLATQETTLNSQEQQQQQVVNAAATAEAQARQQQADQQAALDRAQGQLANLVAQQQAAAAAAERAATASVLAAAVSTGVSRPPPPPAAGGAGAVAVAAAESQVGVPYVWGGASPRGTPGDPSGGFDCSGLTMWAWGRAGVGLSHFSGAQMAASTPVPVSDLQPGDLLFYGPGGSAHVAMYVGGGEMIEAPYTGASVWITPLRLGGGFVGAGRP